MIVVSDTSPINYLILIDAVELLPQLYGRVLVPTHVCQELLDPAGPPRDQPRVREWMIAPPDWLASVRDRSRCRKSSLACWTGCQEETSLAAELRPPLLRAIGKGAGSWNGSLTGVRSSGQRC